MIICYPFIQDPRIQQFKIYGSPWPVIIIVAAYWYFVYVKGPQWMENRKPFELSRVITLFNFIQVIMNSYMAIVVLFLRYKLKRVLIDCNLRELKC